MENRKHPDPVRDPLIWYREMVRYGLEEGVAPGLREKRDELATAILSSSQIEKLADLDEWVLLIIMDLESEHPPVDLLNDEKDQPLSYWWWHLGKLRAGTYPTHVLPPHLRAIYQPVERLAA